MTEIIADSDMEQTRTWYTALLGDTVQEMIRTGAITGIAIEASPVWAAPEKFLIARAWPANKKSDFIWTISGDDVITDHIAGHLVATPKEAARHFALKWQVDADHILNLIKNKAPDEKTEQQMQEQANRLTLNAEILYDLTNLEDIWDGDLGENA